MIVRLDEIGKEFYKRMQDMSLKASIVSKRTGIAESSLSDFFNGRSFRRCFRFLEKLADVLNIVSLTIVFKDHLSEEEYKQLYSQPDYIDLNSLLPEYRKQILKLIYKSNQQKKIMMEKEAQIKNKKSK